MARAHRSTLRRFGLGRRGAVLLACAGLAAATLGCSPEMGRQRMQPGADIGNHSANRPEPGKAPVPRFRQGS